MLVNCMLKWEEVVVNLPANQTAQDDCLSQLEQGEREKRDEPLLRVLHVWLLVVISLRRHDGQDDAMNATMRNVVRFTEGSCC